MAAPPAQNPGSVLEAVSVTVIRPTSGLSLAKMRAAWQRRELLLFLAVRDLKVRYAQTVLGALWTVLQPVSMMLVFTLAFRKIGRVDTAGVPYPVFALAGLTFWTFFSRALTQGAESLVANVQLVTKSSTPRVLVPLAAVASSTFDFGIMLAFLFVFAGGYGWISGWELVALPAVMCLGVLFLAAPLLFFSALNARYRDIRYVLPFGVQIWLFLSPIAYPITALGEPWSKLAVLNPLVGIIGAFRWSLIGEPVPSAISLVSAGLVTAVVLPASWVYFSRNERTLADIV